MLRIQPIFNFKPGARAKCGEIFCHSSKDFTIFCTFCQMKSFQFDDFLLHIKNVHLEIDLKTSLPDSSEFNNCLQVDVKNETISCKKEEDVFYSDMDKPTLHLNVNIKNEPDVKDNTLWCDAKHFFSNCSEDNSESYEEDNIKVLMKRENEIKSKRKQYVKTTHITKDLKNEPNKSTIAKTLSSLPKKRKILEYTCTECPGTFVQKKYLDKHVRDLHNGYKCTLCDKRFNRTSHVQYHLKTHTAEKKFICTMEKCGRRFADEEYLKRHLEVHTMERNFVCEYESCGKAFQTQRRLASHEYTHRIPKKFVCDMCGYSCRSNPQLITHQRIHTGEKPFPCGVCSKPFISKIALQEHMISHSKKRPHVCPICNSAFANRRVLVRHKYIHSDDKTFKCKLCESAFKHPNSLQGHMRHVHREPKLLH